MPAPRVLLLAQRFAPDLGGVARSAERTAGALAAAGCEVDVVAWTRGLPPGDLESLPRRIGAPAVHRVGLFRSEDLSLQHTLGVLDWLHGERDFQLAFGHYLFPPGFAAVWFAGLAGIPSVVSARGNDVDRMAFPPGDFARLRWTLENATRVTAVSEELARKVRLLGGRDALVTPNAVDGAVFAPGPAEGELRAALGIAGDEAVLGFSGELRHKKGLPFLLRALHEVRVRRPACLLVIGEVRPREEEQLARFGVEHPHDRERVLVTGHLEDPAEVARHLFLCDLVLAPSLWDGMPNAVLEAMAAERCVLASDAGGLPEVIRHGEDGFLVPRAQLHRLGEAALELLALDARERRAVGRRARAAVLARHAPEGEVERLGALVDELSSSS